MKKLSERNKMLLLEGGRICGTMAEGYFHAEEHLYIDEARELREFCQWIDDKIGGCAEGNIDMLYNAFKNPNDREAQIPAEALRDRIAEINRLIKK